MKHTVHHMQMNQIDCAQFQQVRQTVNQLAASEVARKTEHEKMRTESLSVLADMKQLRDSAAASAASPAAAPALPGLRQPRFSVGSSFAASSSSSTKSTPFEQRTEVIISGLGEGLSEEQLPDKAIAALQTA